MTRGAAITLAILIAGVPSLLFALNPLQSVGQIISLEGGNAGDFIIRNGDRSRQARVKDLLFSGDCLSVRGDNARATVFLNATRGRAIVDSTKGCVEAGDMREVARPSALAYFVEKVRFLFGRNPPPVSTTTAATAMLAQPPRRLFGLLPPRKPGPLTPPAFLNQPLQFMPSSTPSIAVWWKGSAAEVITSDARGAVLARKVVTGASVAATRMAMHRNVAHVRIASGGQSFEWQVRLVERNQVPLAPFLTEADRAGISDTERVAWMTWLLREGPPEWALYGLSELDRLSDHSYPARRLILAVQADEWPKRYFHIF